jgi:hypothetical protein
MNYSNQHEHGQEQEKRNGEEHLNRLHPQHANHKVW